MKLSPELPISAEDWEHAPATLQAVILLVWRENQTLREQVAKLQNQVEGLQIEVEKLRERSTKIRKTHPNHPRVIYRRNGVIPSQSQAARKRVVKGASWAWSQAERSRRSKADREKPAHDM
jgi:hypothetical protein